MTDNVYIHYRVYEHRQNIRQPLKRNHIDEVLEAAGHLSALCLLLSWVDPRRLTEADDSTLELTLRNLGNLGHAIAGSIYESIDTFERERSAGPMSPDSESGANGPDRTGPKVTAAEIRDIAAEAAQAAEAAIFKCLGQPGHESFVLFKRAEAPKA